MLRSSSRSTPEMIPLIHEFDRTETRPKLVLAVLVLYKRRPEESQAYLAFQQLLKNAEVSAAIELMLCDNSPVRRPVPVGFTGIYLSDVSNPGLAKHYNAAYRAARERGIPWLMLFDQDTTPTKEYLNELLAQIDSLTADQRIVAVVPKLANGSKVYSPHRLPITWSHKSVLMEQWGKSASILAYNSGAVLRVEALCKIGGFPEEFPLEYLDYATFTELQESGGLIYVMKSVLTHELAMSNVRMGISIARYKNILRGEWDFHERYGTSKDRFYFRVRLLKRTLRYLLKEPYPFMAFLTLRAAIHIRPRCRQYHDGS